MDDKKKSYPGKEIFFHEDIDVPLDSPDGEEYNSEDKDNSHDAPPPVTKTPEYDSFMYEPIGFPNPDIKSEQQQAAEFFDGRGHKRRERVMIALFVLLIIITIAIGAGGIAYDIYTSSQRIADINNSNQIVIYQNGKPEGADRLIDEVDENGRYSTEGVAAVVRESIVEIYTYKDAFQSELVVTGS
ncbi:MAG: hypothetical protein K2J26_01755 [Ruminococcus sp.]|nr:hypothetical protein [Ruminococcus sp.]